MNESVAFSLIPCVFSLCGDYTGLDHCTHSFIVDTTPWWLWLTSVMEPQTLCAQTRVWRSPGFTVRQYVCVLFLLCHQCLCKTALIKAPSTDARRTGTVLHSCPLLPFPLCVCVSASGSTVRWCNNGSGFLLNSSMREAGWVHSYTPGHLSLSVFEMTPHLHSISLVFFQLPCPHQYFTALKSCHGNSTDHILCSVLLLKEKTKKF